jgi:DNA (cytosine-5)-methyltransferase 1
MENLQQLESGSVCAGIGGFDLGFERAGIKTAWQIEFDDKANGILARHFPNADRSIRDLTDPHRATLKKVSVLCGGTPCQGFSIAGLRGSLEDDRSNLCLQFVKLVYEIDPAIIVWENVPGVLSSKDNAFGVFLAGLVGASAPIIPPRSIKRWRQSDDGTEYFSWPNAGVVVGTKRTVAWRVLDTQFFGAPQRRERVFLVGDTLGGCSPEILFESKSMCGNYSTGGKTGEEVAGTLGASSGGGFGHDLDRVGAFDECANGKPNVAGPIGCGSAHHGFGTGEIDNHGAYIVARKKAVTDVSPSVTAKWAKGSGGPAGDECQNLVTSVAGRQREGKAGGGKGPLVSENKSLTLGTSNDQVIFDKAQPIAFEMFDGSTNSVGEPTLRSNGDHKIAVAVGIQGGDLSRVARTRVTQATKANGGVNTSLAIQNTGVRRLTPIECERLQGFPDNWTDGQADGSRYKQLGNAVSVPVAEWIGRRIVKALQQKK